MLIAQTDAVKASFTSMPSLKNCISIKLRFYRSKAAAVTSQSDDVTMCFRVPLLSMGV